MASKVLAWIKRSVVLLGAIALFFGYAWLPLQTEGVWNAPDETAAAYFATRIPLLGGSYVEPAGYTETLGGLVHPRSTTVVNGNLVPGMWLGLPWLLRLGHTLTGLDIEWLELGISAVAVLAVLAWGQVIARFFEDWRIGWAAAFALAIHPGWWYYTARGLHPNVLFVALGILSIWAWYVLVPAIRKRWGDTWAYGAVYGGGLLMGLSLFVRTNELIWTGPLLVLAAWRLRAHRKALLWAGAGLFTVACLAGLTQSAVYGSALQNGYEVPADPLPIEIVSDQSVIAGHLFAQIGRLFFPFGFHERTTFTHVFQYHVNFFPLWSAFTLLGAFFLAVRFGQLSEEIRRRIRDVVSGVLIATVYLFIVYGSWHIQDNIDPTAITIGTSYIRYWLPVTVVMTALIGYILIHAIPKRRPDWYRYMAWAVFCVALLFAGVNQVFKSPDEGLLSVHARLQEYQEERDWLLRQTQADDIIIVDRADKVLFPFRHVVVPLRSERTYQMLGEMERAVVEADAQLYYWGMTLPEKDRAFLQEQRLDPHGLVLQEQGSLDEHTLYSFEKP